MRDRQCVTRKELEVSLKFKVQRLKLRVPRFGSVYMSNRKLPELRITLNFKP